MNLQNKNLTMSSRDIADLTGKTHSNVKRDIAQTILQLNYPDIKLKDCPVFDPSELKGHGVTLGSYDHCGNRYDEFHLCKNMTLNIVSGYNPVLRMKIIDRLDELESQTKVSALPNFSNPAEAARAWADQVEQNQAAQLQLESAAPKVEFVDRYVDSAGLKTFRDTCKLLKANEREFRGFLTNTDVMYKLNGGWVAYQGHIDAGRFEVRTGTSDSGHTYNRSLFTPKGVEWISSRWLSYNQRGLLEVESE